MMRYELLLTESAMNDLRNMDRKEAQYGRFFNEAQIAAEEKIIPVDRKTLMNFLKKCHGKY